MKKIIIALLLSIPTLLNAQNEFENYSWNTFPEKTGGDSIACVNGAAVTLERKISEIYANKQKMFEEIFVYHKKVKIESHDALNKFNKIYISLNNVIDIIAIEARFISKSGKVVHLPKESLKKIENLDNKGDYQTFAIEGGEVGGQIEYFFVLRKQFDGNSGYYVQDETPKANVEIIYAYPSKLEYEIKGYNGIPKFTIDETNKEKTYQKTFIKFIPAMDEEKYADSKSNLMRYEYVMSFNHYTSALRTNSWRRGCNNMYQNVYELSSSDVAAASKILKTIDNNGNDLKLRIRTIENWVKNNIAINEDLEYTSSVANMLKLKQANKNAIIRLFSALFQTAGIEFELAETGDNDKRPFDPDFNCTNFFLNTLLYFPSIDSYLTPDDPSYRLGLLSGDVQGQYAIYASPLVFDDNLKTLGYQIKKIPVQHSSLNRDSIQIKLTIDIENSTLNANVRREMHGALGQSFQSFLHLLPKEKKDEFVSSFFSMGDQKSEIKSYTTTNESADNIGYLPLIWNVDLSSNTLIEKAGKDLIVHIGETIGEQSELYQEKKRMQPISIRVLHSYFRQISFDIPKGYQVTNPENLNINVEMKKGDKTSCIFWSKAEIKGNELIVTSREYYLDTEYPASRYNEFRDVINAAADFNKRTILLKKLP